MDKRNIHLLKSLDPYRHLFPPATGINETIKKGATVSDTVNFIPKAIQKYSWQVKNYVDTELKGLPLKIAYRKLFDFVYEHILYEKDETGKEQVRTPRRLIHDGKGDCDCMTFFIDCCLHRLGIKDFTNRITKYEQSYFEHIYPLAPLGKGQNVILDCVVEIYDYEKPYTEKQDYTMDLQLLDGIGGEDKPSLPDNQKLFEWKNDLGELGRLLKKQRQATQSEKKHNVFTRTKEERKTNLKKIGQRTLQVTNKVNKVNPAAALMRAGILASMKLNLMKVAERLKWGYASEALAQSKGMDMSKYAKIKEVLKKAETVFYAAGGKPENLKNAILTGRGNRGHEVAGLDGLSEDTPLPQMLGAIYTDEFVSGMEGFGAIGELGEPVTAASITAASGAMGALAALLNQIGVLFPKKQKQESPAPDNSGSDNAGDNTASTNTDQREPSLPPGQPKPNDNKQDTDNNGGNDASQQPAETETPDSSSAGEKTPENLPAVTDNKTENTEDIPTTEAEEIPNESDQGTNGLAGVLNGVKDFYDKNKKWIIPLGLGALAVTTAIVIHYNGEEKENEPNAGYSMHGTGSRNKKKKKRKGNKGGEDDTGNKSILALM